MRFQSSAGSETVTSQILRGAPADIAILSIERDADRLKKDGFVTSDWHQYPGRGIVNKTPFVIIVRKGNPKGIRDFSDTGQPGVKIIHPDRSAPAAQWSILAIYCGELKKSKAETGEEDAPGVANVEGDLEERDLHARLGTAGPSNSATATR